MALLCATPNANARLWKTTLKINHKTEAFVSLVVMAVVSRWLYSSIPPYQHLSSETIFWPDIVHRTHTHTHPPGRPHAHAARSSTLLQLKHFIRCVVISVAVVIIQCPKYHFKICLRCLWHPHSLTQWNMKWTRSVLNHLLFCVPPPQPHRSPLHVSRSLSLWPVSPRPLQSAWPLRLLYLFYNNIIESMSNNGLY